MEYAKAVTPKQNPKEPPFSAEDWGNTPASIRLFILSMMARIRTLEAEVVSLAEESEPPLPKLDANILPQ